MAVACSFLSEDHFLCSICLDVFTEPVSIPCGHNFCGACINRHWEDKKQCQCPLCNEKFDKGLKLRVNTGFREVVENFKEHHATGVSGTLAKPGQVPCDCCLGNKFRASKTCLVCLTSYCDAHLEPHLRVAALKRHKLTSPVHNLEDQICKKHNRMLELFCRNDQTCVCVLCTEHSSHDTIPLEEAVADRRTRMRTKRAEVQQSKHRRGKKGHGANKAAQARKKGSDEAVSNPVASTQRQDPLMWWIPDQINRFSNVPRNFSKGRFYQEVVAEGSTSESGGAREPMVGIRTFTPRPSNRNWVIKVGTVPQLRARHNFPTQLILIKKHTGVVVFVDYDNGLVSFFDADTGNLAAALGGFNFKKMVYLFYSPEESWASGLQEKAQAIKPWFQRQGTVLHGVVLIVGFYVLIVFLSFVLNTNMT